MCSGCLRRVRYVSDESGCLGIQPKAGGKFHLKLNIGNRPIANKYREGKMKRTLKRELKGLEIAKREPLGRSVAAADITWAPLGAQAPSAACWPASDRTAGRAGAGKVGRPWVRPGALPLQPTRHRAGVLPEGNPKPRGRKPQSHVGVKKLAARRATTAC
jgi:hypothetical protein